MRFFIWWARHKARVVSKHSGWDVTAKCYGIPVGTFRRGREVK